MTALLSYSLVSAIIGALVFWCADKICGKLEKRATKEKWPNKVVSSKFTAHYRNGDVIHADSVNEIPLKSRGGALYVLNGNTKNDEHKTE